MPRFDHPSGSWALSLELLELKHAILEDGNWLAGSSLQATVLDSTQNVRYKGTGPTALGKAWQSFFLAENTNDQRAKKHSVMRR